MTEVLLPEEPPRVSSPPSLSIESSATCSSQETSSMIPENPLKDSYSNKWIPIPDIPAQALRRKFEVDLPNIEVTSLDMTPHGCFVVAGCSNGMVLLFDLTSSSRHGTLAGHIRAKGMHTNLILTVKITEDSRFAFAGCLKGSMEMLAVDMGQIPIWRENSSGRFHRNSSHAPSHVRTYNYLDPKLRGFGAVSRLKPQWSSVDDDKYVLICGKGIKSVHVWLFTPAADSKCAPAPPYSLLAKNKVEELSAAVTESVATTDSSGGPVWTFLFDVATNGVTIEALGFRFCHKDISTESSKVNDLLIGNGNIEDSNESISKTESKISLSTSQNEPVLQMLSKSRGMCVRVWDLVDLDRDMSEENESELGKLSHEDIPNSNDCRVFSDDGEMAFGGLYNFSVLRLDAPKWANRETYEVPARCTEDDAGQRRRRLMREINEVIACHDGNHVLALCTDGGVLYYQYERSDPSREDICSSYGSLVEFQKLTREVEIGPEYMTDDSWAIKSVGKNGSVVLIRACKALQTENDEGGGATVDISLLSDLAEECSNTSSYSSSFVQRNKGFCYHDDTFSKSIDSAIGSSSTQPLGKPPSGRLRKRVKDKDKKDKTKKNVNKERESTPREKRSKINSSSPGSHFSTPAEMTRGLKQPGDCTSKHSNKAVMNISPQDNVQPLESDGDVSAVSKRLYPPTPTKKNSHEANTLVNERKSTRKRTLTLRVKDSYESDDDTIRKDECPSNDGIAAFTPRFFVRTIPQSIPHPGPAPKVKRVKVASYVYETESQTKESKSMAVNDSSLPNLLSRFRETKKETWNLLSTSSFVAGIHLCDSTFLTMMGPNICQTAESLLLEQDRLYQLFIVDFLRGLEKAIAQQVVIESSIDHAIACCKEFLQVFLGRFKDIVSDVMKSQIIQMRCAMSNNDLLSRTSRTEALVDESGRFGISADGDDDNHYHLHNLKLKKWTFVHCGMYKVAEGIVESVEKMAKKQF